MNHEEAILALAVAFVALALTLLAMCIRQQGFEKRTKEAFEKMQNLINKGAASHGAKRM